MQASMCAAINTAMAQIDGRTSVVILKRLWDETPMRVQLDQRGLDLLVGKQFAADVIACKRHGRKGKGSVYPGYVVQSFSKWHTCGGDGMSRRHRKFLFRGNS